MSLLFLRLRIAVDVGDDTWISDEVSPCDRLSIKLEQSTSELSTQQSAFIPTSDSFT